MRSRQVLLFSATFSLLTLFVVWYIRQERYIYFWDFDVYHYLYRELGPRFSRSLVDAVHAIVASVRTNDYNMLPTLLLMPFYFAFGSGRLAYILVVTVSFAFPAIFLFTRLMDHFHGGDSRTKAEDKLFFLLIAVAVIALTPQFWLPILRGYVDVVGLNIIFIVLIRYWHHDLAEQTLRDLIVVGLLLSLLVLLRRWYAYWVVGFFSAMAISTLAHTLSDHAPLHLLQRRGRHIVLVGTTAVLSFFVIATPIAFTMLTTNYRATFAAYRSSDSVFFHIAPLSRYFGVPVVVASILGLLLMSVKAGKGHLAVFITVQFAITFILFTKTQYLAIHHYYGVAVTLFLLTAFCLQEACAWLKMRRYKIAFVSGVIVACACNLLATVHEGGSNFFSPVSFAFPQERAYPLKGQDLEQVRHLLRTLNMLTRDSDGKIYILASSNVLNARIVKSGGLTFEPALVDLERRVLHTHDVDTRNGLPSHFFQAQYAVVTDPIGYHLSPEHQRVVGLFAEELVKSEGLGQSYEKLSFVFPLGDGSTAFIYKRNSHFKADDLKRLSDTFVALYPEYEGKFAITPEMIRKLSGTATSLR